MTQEDKYKNETDEFGAIKRALAEKPKVQISPETLENTKHMVRTELVKQSLKRRTREARLRWILAPAALAAFLFLGIFLGKYVLVSPHSAAKEHLQSKQYLNVVMKEYLEDITPLLINYANYKTAHRDERFLLLDRRKTEDLAFQTRFLRNQTGMTEKHRELELLLEDLDILLTEILNRDMSNSLKMELIKETIRSQDLLFKIKYHASRMNGRRSAGDNKSI